MFLKRSFRGFTLVELMIVIAVVSLLLALGATSLSNTNDSLSCKNTAEFIANDLSYQLNYCRAIQQDCGILFRKTNNTFNLTNYQMFTYNGTQIDLGKTINPSGILASKGVNIRRPTSRTPSNDPNPIYIYFSPQTVTFNGDWKYATPKINIPPTGQVWNVGNVLEITCGKSRQFVVISREGYVTVSSN